MNHTIQRKNGRIFSLTSLGLLGGVALAAACSSEPFEPPKPEATGGTTENTGGAEADGGDEQTGGREAGGAGGASTGGDGGEGMDDGGVGEASAGGVGEASAGGRPGTEDSGVAPECVRDSDCVALTCNGEPRCNDDGKCDPGLPCENPDPDHCSVACVRGDGGSSCELQGLDADVDGHLDAACVSGGGDDCDDKKATTYAGAEERCDGVDNDCDGLADVEDGVPLAGTPTVVQEITGTASLGMAAAPEGWGILKMERTAARLKTSTATDVIFVDPASKATATPLSGDFRDEPSIAYAGKKFFVYDANGQGSGARFQWVAWGAKTQEVTYEDAPGGLTGRAFPSSPGDHPSMVFTTNASDLASAGVNVFSYQSILGGLVSLPVKTVVSPVEVYRPAFASGGYAWVQSNGPRSADHQLTIHFWTTIGEVKTLQAVNVVGDGSAYKALRFETLRPQVISTADDNLAGWMSDAGLHFARFAKDGSDRCRAEPVAKLASWGWTNALANDASDVYAVAVTSEREPVLIKIDEACRVSEPIRLAASGGKVALGITLWEGKPFLEVGHPVIARYGDGRLGAAWVEEPKSNGLYRVMFRTFGSKLCN